MARSGDDTVLDLDGRPDRRKVWLVDLIGHREVFVMMSKADFQSKYKRSSLGIIWAVVVPLLQALVITVVFSKVIQVQSGRAFGLFVLSGIVAWSYVSGVIGSSATAIVDGTALTDKVWFPRSLLAAVPLMSNLPPFFVSVGVMILTLPVLKGTYGFQLLWIFPAFALMIAFTLGLSLCLSALHVYFRDVRFIVQAALIVWFYVTPIAYQQPYLKNLAGFLDFNPMTGVVDVFRDAVFGADGDYTRAIIVTVVASVVLLVVGLEAQRRYDRLFVDLL